MPDSDETSEFAAFEPAQDGIELVKPIDAVDIEAERLERKQRLACGLRTLGRLHLAEGVAGHITVRDPELTDHFWVNPFGTNFKLMKVSDLILVSDTGQVVEGDKPVNAAAFAIHSQIHASSARRCCRRALSFDVRQDVLHSRPPPQDDHPRLDDVLQRRCALR